MDPQEAKAALRTSCSRAVQLLTPEERVERSDRAVRRVAELDALRRPGTIVMYSPLEDEVDVSTLREHLHGAGWQICFPKVVGEGLELIRVHEGTAMSPGFRGVLEPVGTVVSPLDVDVVIVPGRAFDHAGARVGRGAGHYDRLLANCSADTIRVGVCFTEQVVIRIPTEDHDELVHWVVTAASAHRTSLAGPPVSA